MSSKVTREYLEDMTIWQLRDYARKMGHNSPTSQKKADLVQYIYETSQQLENGGDLEEIIARINVATTKKRGRPPKDIITKYVNLPEGLAGGASPADNANAVESKGIVKKSAEKKVEKQNIDMQKPLVPQHDYQQPAYNPIAFQQMSYPQPPYPQQLAYPQQGMAQPQYPVQPGYPQYQGQPNFVNQPYRTMQQPYPQKSTGDGGVPAGYRPVGGDGAYDGRNGQFGGFNKSDGRNKQQSLWKQNGQDKKQQDRLQNQAQAKGGDRAFERNKNQRDIGDVNAQNGNKCGAKENDMSVPASETAEKQAPSNADEVGVRQGILEICPDGYGFLRAKNYEQGENDAYIAAPKIRKVGLRKGDEVVAMVKKIAENKPWCVQEIISVNGNKSGDFAERPTFESLTTIYPNERYRLEILGEGNDYAIRAIDLVAPIGKGQRALIVSPPKAGKTTLLKKIANSISVNNPDAHLIVLLVDERPEEVTDMQRSIKGEVVYSTFDEQPEHHTKCAEMVLDRAKRLVELGQDVVILLDSLTRLTRAYNLTIAPTGKTLSGGIDPGALYNPKRFFGAARNFENGGSLTIIATALVDTGSRMDDVIFEEFKGTGNMEIHLDRRLSEKRIFPAIDLYKSGTRKEELLLDKNELDGIWSMRKLLSIVDAQECTEKLLNMLTQTRSNKEFLEKLITNISYLEKKSGYSLRATTGAMGVSANVTNTSGVTSAVGTTQPVKEDSDSGEN